MLDSRQWAVAAILSMALHLFAAYLWVSGRASVGAKAAGIDGIEIGIGLAGRYVAKVSREVAETQEAPEAVKPKVEKEQPVKNELRKPPKRKVQAAPLKKPKEHMVSQVAPVFTEQVESMTTFEQASDDQQIEEETGDNQNKSSDTSATIATGSGERVETGGNPAARQSYLAQVAALIARHKRYPRAARHDGVTGVVTVHFVIRANGSLQTQQVVNSSGDLRLDQAALEMLTRASPFPPIPEEMGTDALELTLPVEFSLHQKRF